MDILRNKKLVDLSSFFHMHMNKLHLLLSIYSSSSWVTAIV